MGNISEKVYALAEKVEPGLRAHFEEIEKTAEKNTARVLAAFQKERVSEACFAGSTGYGYGDIGRETLDRIYADVFDAEAALVRAGFVNGTHAIASALFAALRPGDTLLSATGPLYDTLNATVGADASAFGSLKYYGINFDQVEFSSDGGPDCDAIFEAAARLKPAAVFVQRSRGYSERRALSVAEIWQICEAVKKPSPQTVVICDNCYGEFTEFSEPTHVGADLVAGSLIKNPGGGLAPTGGYVAGRRDLVENAAQRLTVPGIGGECGATLGISRELFQGLFLAPHTVAQALKTAVFCSAMLREVGIDTSPAPEERRSDIIQMIRFGSKDKLLRFCRGIQHASPVDSHVTPEPWRMPGYDCEVVMAAGTFVQGSSIELSCDGPVRAPYIAYLQGGLTYESGKFGVMTAISEMLD